MSKRKARLIRRDKKRMLRELREIGAYEQALRRMSYRAVEKHYITALMILNYD